VAAIASRPLWWRRDREGAFRLSMADQTTDSNPNRVRNVGEGGGGGNGDDSGHGHRDGGNGGSALAQEIGSANRTEEAVADLRPWRSPVSRLSPLARP